VRKAWRRDANAARAGPTVAPDARADALAPDADADSADVDIDGVDKLMVMAP
jgi:hypothetical protein